MRRARAGTNTIVISPSSDFALTPSELDDLVWRLDDAVPGLDIRAERVRPRGKAARGVLDAIDAITVYLPDGLASGLLTLLGKELLSAAVQWARGRWRSKASPRPIRVVVLWPDGTHQEQRVEPPPARRPKRSTKGPRGRKR